PVWSIDRGRAKHVVAIALKHVAAGVGQQGHAPLVVLVQIIGVPFTVGPNGHPLQNFVHPFAVHVHAHRRPARVIFQDRFVAIVKVIGGGPTAERAFHTPPESVVGHGVNNTPGGGRGQSLIVDVRVGDAGVSLNLVVWAVHHAVASGGRVRTGDVVVHHAGAVAGLVQVVGEVVTQVAQRGRVQFSVQIIRKGIRAGRVTYRSDPVHRVISVTFVGQDGVALFHIHILHPVEGVPGIELVDPVEQTVAFDLIGGVVVMILEQKRRRGKRNLFKAAHRVVRVREIVAAAAA